jgi:transcriptional regulator with XRE-family HTH domain
MFGEVLKKARKKAGKTLMDVADHCGLTIGNLSDIEHGRRRPPKEEILLDLEYYLGVPKKRLINAAKKNWKVPHAAISIFMKRPAATMSLLRSTENMSESELKQLIVECKKRKRKHLND